MANPSILPCDGCGQLASAEHISRRLQRLEWATRFRPIHMQALLLAVAAPESDDELLYAPESHFTGLAGQILAALSIPHEGKSAEEILTEVQRRGLYLAYALECPVERNSDASLVQELLDRHLSHALVRIRRSLKPKRVLVLSPELQLFLSQLSETALSCPVFYAPLSPSASGSSPHAPEMAAFRDALPSLATHST